MLFCFLLIGFATVISWLLLCFFSPALWLIFCGGWGETTVLTKDWWWPWLFPRHGAPFSRQTWHIESLYVQMFYPLESLKVLGAPVPRSRAKGLCIIRAQCKFVTLATSAPLFQIPRNCRSHPGTSHRGLSIAGSMAWGRCQYAAVVETVEVFKKGYLQGGTPQLASLPSWFTTHITWVYGR